MKPRIGFLGVGWIGRIRMEAAVATGLIEAIAICDPSAEMVPAAVALAPSAKIVASLDAMLAEDVDGVVIATPSALHAAQAIEALQAGAAVFCQKPMGRSAEEVRHVVSTAKSADRLLSVDLSYRFTEGVQHIRAMIARGELGRIFAVDLTFHNAYGPDKSWFYDKMQAGGGCMTDLGIHLVDLAFWMLDRSDVEEISGALFARGVRITGKSDHVEDFGTATLRLTDGAVVRVACSWNLHAGQNAVIDASIYGSKGGAAFRNIGGSFFDFTAERFRGTARETLCKPPDNWGGRAIEDWCRRLAAGERFSSEAEELVRLHRVLDSIYE